MWPIFYGLGLCVCVVRVLGVVWSSACLLRRLIIGDSLEACRRLNRPSHTEKRANSHTDHAHGAGAQRRSTISCVSERERLCVAAQSIN